MGAPAAQFQFAAEIVAFLVCLAGTALLLLRPALLTLGRGAAGLMAAGFAAVGAGAFVHGALQAGTVDPPGPVALRLGGGVLLLAGALPARRWTGGALARGLLVPAGLLFSAAGAVALGHSLYGSEAVLVAGAAAAGVGLGVASQRAIGARLTAAAAGTLLLVVVTLSVALSTVLSGTVRDDALRRLQSRASVLATTIADSWLTNESDAKLVAASVEGLGLSGPDPGAELQPTITDLTTRFFSTVELMWVGPQGTPLAVSPRLAASVGPGVAEAVAGSNLVVRSLQTGQPGGTAGVAAGRAIDVAAYPARAPGTSTVTGVAVVLSPLDSSYLGDQIRDDSTLSAALVANGLVLSAFPRSSAHQPAGALRTAAQAGAGHPTAPVTAGSTYVVAASVLGGSGQPVMAVLVESPTSVVDSTRQSLFRTLFLIAFGGSIIAFVLSVAVADRVSRALGELTGAARRITTGETGVRTGVTASDEIGVLADAMDSMAESVEQHSDALRGAAAEEARLRARIQSVIAGMGEALVSVDADGTVSEWNLAAERLLGVSRPEAVGRPVTEVLSARLEDGTDVAALLAAGPAAARPAGRGTLDGPGGAVPVAVSFGVVPADPDAPVAQDAGAGTVGVLRDLRPELELERMKTEFLSRVGHELRTPLTGILGFSQLLANRDVSPERARAWHEEILQQSRRLLRTVEMLEFFASAGGNRLGLDLASVEARAVVDQAAERWEAKVTPTHRIVGRAERGLPDVEMDRRWVDLALDELIDNAVKFSPDGGQVVVAAAADGSGRVRFSVADEGPGMTEAEMAGAFGEFVQGDSSDTRRYGGLGLGLPLVQRVAEAHGGAVELTSEPGRGARATILLPAGQHTSGAPHATRP